MLRNMATCEQIQYKKNVMDLPTSKDRKKKFHKQKISAKGTIERSINKEGTIFVLFMRNG